ncbi:MULTISPECIES: DUF7129 domain-containing putative zinc-binding protein [Salinibaculum]
MPVHRDPASGGESLYECLDCSRHIENPDGRLCECGGYLQNIGVPRQQ